MKRIIYFIILFYCCKSEYNPCLIYDDFVTIDGKYRKQPESNLLISVIDSLYRASGAKNKIEDDFIEAAMDSLKSPFFNPNFNEELGMRLMQQQIELDSINFLGLMHQIEIDKDKKIDTLECYQKSLIIFVHTPNGLIDVVSLFVEKHKALIPENNYQHILWHLQGRGIKKI